MKEFSKEEMMSFARFCRESIYMLDSRGNHPAKKFEKSYIQMLKIQSDAIYIIIEINKKKYSLNIYIDNKKPSYIFINIQ